MKHLLARSFIGSSKSNWDGKNETGVLWSLAPTTQRTSPDACAGVFPMPASGVLLISSDSTDPSVRSQSEAQRRPVAIPHSLVMVNTLTGDLDEVRRQLELPDQPTLQALHEPIGSHHVPV